ncbi:MBL fold metallo-hydrolase [Subtercola endophyticus]|uniref:MBL fold metallo-hydrolase n=1 Tax=Subtercola endophyticus TaxID=2895559 RepID=UPI001E46C371|nr:MBL fold metallo-hydrolase [Subtercola endophyticus]UFS59791.1 MBL fold metallo-hydrolase [Subtercola endophyticus]
MDAGATTGADHWLIGEIPITKHVEMLYWSPLSPAIAQGWDSGSLEEVLAMKDWLEPTWMNEAGEIAAGVHSFLIETPDGKRLIVDTGIGNDKQRAAAMFSGLHTDFLDRLTEIGWSPETVDGVICTHLHIDHTGWNTILVDGEWRPTFPNARYYFVRSEYEHWKSYADDPEAGSGYTSDWARQMVDGAAVFNDSVRPIADAGLMELVQSDATIAPGVRLVPSPGHTPGHVCVVIESNGESAVITGDMAHSIYQVARPEWSSQLDTDMDQSRATRKRLVAEWADSGTLVLGTHFGPPTCGHVHSDGEHYRID